MNGFSFLADIDHFYTQIALKRIQICTAMTDAKPLFVDTNILIYANRPIF